MSKIQAAIAEAMDIKPKRNEDRQAFLARAVKAIADASDEEWDGLTQDVQDWFNAAADAKNAKAKTLPDFPDAEEAETPAEEKKSTRRSAAKDDDEPKATPGTKAVKTAKKGMALKIVNKRGKEYTGHVVEVDDEVVVLKQGNGEEVEIDVSRIDTMHTLDTDSSDEEAADPIKVGAEVTVTNKRGKEFIGKILELDDEVIVLDTADGEEELSRDRVESIKVVGGKKAAKEEPAEEKKSTRRSSTKEEAKDEPETKAKRSSNEGVSVGQRIKELIADDIEASVADIEKALKKEGLEYRENTLKLNYADAHKFIDILKAKKMLKL